MTYRAMPFPRFLLPLVLVVFAAVAIGTAVAASRGSGPPVLSLVFWLSWRTALSSRQLPVGDVVRVRPTRMNRQMAVIELQGRRPLLVPVRYGFGELTRAITAAAPHASVEGA